MAELPASVCDLYSEVCVHFQNEWYTCAAYSATSKAYVTQEVKDRNKRILDEATIYRYEKENAKQTFHEAFSSKAVAIGLDLAHMNLLCGPNMAGDACVNLRVFKAENFSHGFPQFVASFLLTKLCTPHSDCMEESRIG